MKALIFAAGRGERLRPLTDHTPKPLVKVRGKPLIVWHLENLAALGIRDVVINTSWLADRFPAELGNGAQWGLRLHYLYEGPTPLETGGGMLNALPLLGDAPFVLMNGDVFSDFDLGRLPRRPRSLAHLVLVDRPDYVARGDFALGEDGELRVDGEPLLTYSGIGVYDPRLLAELVDPPRAFPLAPILRAAMQRGLIHGEHHRGSWTDVGTLERYRALNGNP